MRQVVTSSDSMEWLQDAVSQGVVPADVFYPVTAINMAQSGKGFTLTVAVPDIGNYAVFVWRSGKLGQVILDFLTESYATRELKTVETYPELCVLSGVGKNLPLGLDDIPCKEYYKAVNVNRLNPGETANVVLVPKKSGK